MGEPVLVRAFRLLDAFSDSEPTLSLTRLSEIAGIPISSTLRLALTLVQLGALERSSTGEFSVGLWLLERATLAPRGHGLRETALPFMEDLHRATRQHVLLGVREVDEVILIERLSALHAGKVDYRVGGRLPLHVTGIGLVLLANAGSDFRSSYIARPLKDERGEPVSPTELQTRLDFVRRAGVARNFRSLPEPAMSVAAPVTKGDHVVAALSVVGADGSMEPGTIEPAVIAIAHAISRALTTRAAR